MRFEPFVDIRATEAISRINNTDKNVSSHPQGDRFDRGTFHHTRRISCGAPSR
jgi:hypothetical protein